MSLRTRIALVASLAVAVTVVAAAVATYAATRAELRGQVDDALRERVRPAMEGGPPGGGPGGPGHGGGIRRRFGGVDPRPRVPFGGAAGSLQLVTPTGETFQPPGDNAPLPVDDETREIAAEGEGMRLADARANGVHLRVLTVGAGPNGALQVARPLTEVDDVLQRQLLVLFLVGGAGIIAAGALGFVVARTALAPVERFTSRAESLATTPDLSERLDVEGSDEIARLAQTFNSMLAALEASVEAQKHLVADASHELRTPLASLRANIQVLQDADRLPDAELAALRADIVSELDELTMLVSDVVDLARGAKQADVLDDIRLDQVVRELADRARRRPGDLRFDLDLEPTIVTGEPDRISRAVSNLLDNARKWSPPGGVVDVSLRDGELTVRDRGPGFGEQDLPHVFERFYRSDEARAMPGSGLGLAIVKQAAEANGGRVAAENADGGGALLRVRF